MLNSLERDSGKGIGEKKNIVTNFIIKKKNTEWKYRESWGLNRNL